MFANCLKKFKKIDVLSKINTDEKAYLLGWIAGNKNLTLHFQTDKHDLRCLEKIRDIIDPKIMIKKKDDYVYFEIISKSLYNDVSKHLQINNGSIKFPHFDNPDYKWSFIRGLFDNIGELTDYKMNSIPECTIFSDSADILKGIASISKIPCLLDDNKITYQSNNFMEFLEKLYTESNWEYRIDKKYGIFIEWCTWQCLVQAPKARLPYCKVYKTDKNAVFPSKVRLSDVGYDLTIIRVEKKWFNNIMVYDTGIKINMAQGYYAEIMPKKNLTKNGYMLANNIGIIDPSYIGRILIALTKIDSSVPDIKLPFKCCELVFKQQINMNMMEVINDFEN